jgi:rubrerythrin
MGFNAEITKKINVGFALLRIEYAQKSGEFDSKKYSKALENYYNTIDTLKIVPSEEFLSLGVEHYDQLDENHKKMFFLIKNSSEKIEAEALPKFLTSFIEGFPSKKCDKCGNQVIEGSKFCPQCGAKMGKSL